MPTSSGRNYRASNRSKEDAPKPLFFSAKPPKADLRAIKAKLENEPHFISDFLALPNPDGRLWTKNDEEEGTVIAFYSIGAVAKGQPDRICIGRGSTLLRAVAVIAHWFQTLDLEYMFPSEAEEPEEY